MKFVDFVVTAGYHLTELILQDWVYHMRFSDPEFISHLVYNYQKGDQYREFFVFSDLLVLMVYICQPAVP